LIQKTGVSTIRRLASFLSMEQSNHKLASFSEVRTVCILPNGAVVACRIRYKKCWTS